jgi:hypothetical protein
MIVRRGSSILMLSQSIKSQKNKQATDISRQKIFKR